MITGGAGFIGSHLCDELLNAGYRVRVLDNLEPQVHGPARERPGYLDARVELQIGDVRDADAVARALNGVQAVFHLAARVGVGQSMYEMSAYMDTNVTGTGVLLEQIARQPVERLVVASSMSIYGEGAYQDAAGASVEAERDAAELRRGNWDIRDATGQPLQPVATPESKRPALTSIYALSKFDQEQMCLLFGRAYDVPTVALRFFNTYGERQALSNPYTGVMAIFANRLLHDREPLIFEDGLQRRDFVHVRDVARACRLALERPEAAGCAINVGSGRSITILELARRAAEAIGRNVSPQVTGEARIGDIRHCFADIGVARERLGFEPGVDLDSGLKQLTEWLAGEQSVDRVDEAFAELRTRGLAV